MGWSTAPLAVRVTVIAAFFAIAAALALATHQPDDPQWAIQAAISIGCGGIVAWLVLLAGNAVTHPRTRHEAQFWLSRESYTRRSVPLMLQLALIAAMSVTCIAYILKTADTGSWFSAWTALLLFVVVVWPFIRHRIERGFWPD